MERRTVARAGTGVAAGVDGGVELSRSDGDREPGGAGGVRADVGAEADGEVGVSGPGGAVTTGVIGVIGVIVAIG